MREFTDPEEVSFTLKTTPKPQARARVQKGWAYDPTKEYKDWVKWNIIDQIGRIFKPFSGPVSVTMTFRMPIAASSSKKMRKALLEDPRHIKRPDGKNLYTAIEDAMTGIIYDDDNQVWEFIVRKVYDEEEGIDVSVTGQYHKEN